MELQLKNIGMIKEANVKIDGLTVIAGENDTGKSTVGKALYLLLMEASAEAKLDDYLKTFNKELKKEIDSTKIDIALLSKSLFQNDLFGAKIKLYFPDTNGSVEYEFFKNEHNLLSASKDYSFFKDNIYLAIMIETPLVWNFTDFFRDIAQIESQFKIELDYPYLMKDLNFKLHIKSASSGLDIKDKVTSLMGGEFKKDEMGRYYFDKQGKRIELVNTATGIKYFAIFQVLSQNNYLNKDTVLVLDEPEVHLHPKWQLEMAKIIVELVKNGLKIVVNSHSPYMIDALKYYADEFQVDNNFYLAEKNEDGSSSINDVTMDLSPIFEKLTEPLRKLHKMKVGLS